MAVKYQILFNDVDGNACKITFDFAGWSGPVSNVVASGDPVTISYQGDQDNLFQQIVTSMAVIRCIAQPDFVQDTRDIDDREVFVTITTPAGTWIGYLITYQRSEKFDSGGYELEMIAKDPFSYLKENSYQLLANKYVMGLQNMAAICKNIIDESHSLPVEFISNYKPIDGSGAVVTLPNTFTRIFMRLETFMDDGLLPSGYDIIGKICDLFNTTSFICDGKMYFRQPRALIDLPTKPIGEISKHPDFLIGDEELTRTKSFVQLGVRHSYGEVGGNIVPNSFFYYVDPNAAEGDEIMHWQYPAGSNEVTRSQIIREDGKGIFIRGLMSGIESFWPGSLFFFSLTDFNTNVTQADTLLNNEYLLRVKYRYHRYVLTRTTKEIKYAMRVFAVFGDGSMVSLGYDGEGGRNVTTNNWQERPGSGNPNPPLQYLVTFPLDATGNESTFELGFACKPGNGFPSGKGDYQLLVNLYPISSGTTNGGIPNDKIPDEINITECSISPNIYTMPDFSLPDINLARNRVESALFMSDNTNIRSNKKFKEVADPIEVVAGVKKSEAPDAVIGDPVQYIMSNLNGSLQLSPTEPIEKFDSNGTQDKLVTLNARDRMYFLRQPRNKITVDIRSSNLKFTDILSFPGFIEGKYVQMESEYRVAECEHTVTVQELKGSDDETDIIENYLSSE